MLYNVLYDGPKIDEILGYTAHIKTVQNGWIKKESTMESPVDLNKMIIPGNFKFDYFNNGPENTSLVTPLNLIVTSEDQKIRQNVFSSGYIIDAWYRIYNPTDKSFTEWRNYRTDQKIYVADTSPENPSNFTIWINTNNKDAIFQYYDANTDEWKKINPDDYMDPLIYNPNNVDFQNDVYQYIDNVISGVSFGESTIDFASHINNSTIHVTQAEKDLFNSKMTSDNLSDSMQEVLNNIKDYINSQSIGTITEIPEIVERVNALRQTLETHMSDTTIHPSQSQIDYWNSKSDPDHTHTIDQIKIDAKDVVTGVLNSSNFSDEVKERQVTVTTEEELLALTYDDVQNGDFVLINYSDTKNELLIVKDQTKLGTRDAFISYNEVAQDVSWDMIIDKPTDILDLDIIDLMINRNVDILQNNSQELLNNTKAAINETVDIYEKYKEEYKNETCHLETEIDDTDFKLTYMYYYLHLPDEILTKIEELTN